MNSSVASLYRAPVRPVFLLSLLILALLLLVPPAPSYAFEKQTFEDLVVGPDGTSEGVSTAFGDVVINGRVEGDVETRFGDVEVNAPVDGRVEAAFGNVYVGSSVEGDVKAGHGDVYLMDGAEVGDVILGTGEVYREGNPRITGSVSASMVPMTGGEDQRSVLGLAGWFFGSLVFVAVAVLAAVFAPRQLAAPVRKIEESFARSLLVGLASVPAAVVLSVVLAVSLVGIPLLLLAAPAYLAFVFFGALVAAYFIGRRVLLATGRYHAGNALAAAIGASILSGAYLVPFIGGLLLYGFALLGAGATIMALFSHRRTYPSYETYVRERRV